VDPVLSSSPIPRGSTRIVRGLGPEIGGAVGLGSGGGDTVGDSTEGVILVGEGREAQLNQSRTSKHTAHAITSSYSNSSIGCRGERTSLRLAATLHWALTPRWFKCGWGHGLLRRALDGW
jgi:hypothetical protein